MAEQDRILELTIHKKDIPEELSRLFLSSMAHQGTRGWGQVNPLEAHATFTQVASTFMQHHRALTSDRLRLLDSLGRCDPPPHPADLMAVLSHCHQDNVLYPGADAAQSLELTVALLESLPNPRPVVTLLGELLCDPSLDSPTVNEWLTLLEEPVASGFWELPAPLLIPLLRLPHDNGPRQRSAVESRLRGAKHSRPPFAHLRSTP